MVNDRIVIFGAGGMLGTALVKIFKNSNVYAFTKAQVDITSKSRVLAKIREIMPGIVINSAAYTDVDGCERNKELAFNVNGRAVKVIAQACRKNNAIMVHMSTDYIFDGRKKYYKENDKANPISIYGKSKMLGEKSLMETLDNYYLIRASWLFGPNSKNFVDTILRIAKEKKEIKVVNDQFGKPTYAIDLAKKIREVIYGRKAFGIYHITNEGVCNWFEFARKIVQFAKLKTKVLPIKSAQLGRPAKRPEYSALLNTKLQPLRHWSLALREYIGVK